ncbi:MAG: hypothetical protein AAF658_04330, partial [Myxococcota bacterium]
MNRGALQATTVLIALRNLASHRRSTILIGSIMVFGTALVVTGTSMIDSVHHSMGTSVTGSVAGHIQVYSADHRDPLALFGTGLLASEDVGELPKFEEVDAALGSLENVRAVIPMGIRVAQVIQG